MPEHTLEERLRTKTADRIAALDASEQGARTAKPKAKPKPKEKTGTGTSSFDLEGAIAKIQARINATTDPAMKAKLKARIEALRKNAG